MSPRKISNAPQRSASRPGALQALALTIVTSLVAASLSACSSILLAPRHPAATAAVDRLLSGDDTLHAEAKVEIQSLGEGAMPELRERFQSSDGEQRLSIIELATTIGSPDKIAIDILRRGSQDESAAVRRSVAFRSAHLQELYPPLSPILLPLMWDSNPEVQAAAINTLSVFPTELSMKDSDLESLMRSSSPLVVAAASSTALTRSAPELREAAVEVLPNLVGEMMNPSPLIRAAVIIAIGKYGKTAEPAIPPLAGSLSYDPLPEIQLQAAIALLRIETPAARKIAIPALKSFSKSENSAIATMATQALEGAKE